MRYQATAATGTALTLHCRSAVAGRGRRGGAAVRSGGWETKRETFRTRPPRTAQV